MNLTNRPVYAKGQKRKRSRKASVSHLAELIARAKAKGAERQYLDWLKTQPSALGTGWDYDWELGNICTPAHFRTASNSGIGMKPEYQAIPLKSSEHALQHKIGTFAFQPREWWEEMAERYLMLWISTVD
jgi:hypothetical protein